MPAGDYTDAWLKLLNNSQASFRNILLPTDTTVQLAGPDPNRIAIIFGNNAAAGTYFINLDPGLAGAEGILVGPNNGPVTINLNQHGGAVHARWFGRTAAGGTNIHVVEVFRGAQ